MRRLLFTLCLCFWLPVAFSADDNGGGSNDSSQTAEEKKPADDKKGDKTQKPSTDSSVVEDPDC